MHCVPLVKNNGFRPLKYTCLKQEFIKTINIFVKYIERFYTKLIKSKKKLTNIEKLNDSLYSSWKYILLTVFCDTFFKFKCQIINIYVKNNHFILLIVLFVMCTSTIN